MVSLSCARKGEPQGNLVYITLPGRGAPSELINFPDCITCSLKAHRNLECNDFVPNGIVTYMYIYCLSHLLFPSLSCLFLISLSLSLSLVSALLILFLSSLSLFLSLSSLLLQFLFHSLSSFSLSSLSSKIPSSSEHGGSLKPPVL